MLWHLQAKNYLSGILVILLGPDSNHFRQCSYFCGQILKPFFKTYASFSESSLRAELEVVMPKKKYDKAAADLASPPPPRRPNSFDFMQFSGQFGKIICWRPSRGVAPSPGEILDPPLNGNDCWLKHCRLLSLQFFHRRSVKAWPTKESYRSTA